MNNKIKALIIIVAVVLLVPFGYKQYVGKKVINEINSLNEKGFLVTLKSDESNFLSTKLTYKAIVSNPKKIYKEFFAKLLNVSQYSPLNKLFSSLNGSELTIDINILNFPVNHENAISIYLTSLPAKAQNLQKKELFLQEVSTFLKNRGFGESLDINALGKVTKIKFKNIDQQFDNKKSTVHLNVENYITDIQKLDFQKESYTFTTMLKAFGFAALDKRGRGVEFFSKNLKCSVDRDDLFNYSTACTVKKVGLKNKKYKQNAFLIDDISLSSISKSTNNLVSYKFKYKIKDISIQQISFYKNRKIDLSNFKYAGSINGIDKNLIKKFSTIIYSGNNLKRSKEFKQTVLKLLNEGFDFNIDEFGIGQISVKAGNKTFNFGKIKVNAELKVLKNNLNAAMKPKIFDLLKYVTLNAKIEILKKDFKLLQKYDRRGKMNLLSKLAKISGDKMIFEIVLKDKKLTINGKSII